MFCLRYVVSMLDEAECERDSRPSRRANAAACAAAIDADRPFLLPAARICSGVIRGDLGGNDGGVTAPASCSRLVSVSIACVRGERIGGSEVSSLSSRDGRWHSKPASGQSLSLRLVSIVLAMRRGHRPRGGCLLDLPSQRIHRGGLCYAAGSADGAISCLGASERIAVRSPCMQHWRWRRRPSLVACGCSDTSQASLRENRLKTACSALSSDPNPAPRSWL